MRKRGRQGKRLPFDGLCACAEPVHGVRQLQSRFNGRKYPSIVENISVDKKCQRWHIYSVSEVGKRLKNARIAKGLSLRKFAERFREDFAVLAHIEAGRRFPPKRRRKKFADVLSLTLAQLDALIAVERRGLNPFEMLPEIVPAAIPTELIEAEAERILSKYFRTSNKVLVDGPIPAAEVLKVACGLSTEYLDFAEARIRTHEAATFTVAFILTASKVGTGPCWSTQGRSAGANFRTPKRWSPLRTRPGITSCIMETRRRSSFFSAFPRGRAFAERRKSSQHRST